MHLLSSLPDRMSVCLSTHSCHHYQKVKYVRFNMKVIKKEEGPVNFHLKEWVKDSLSHEVLL